MTAGRGGISWWDNLFLPVRIPFSSQRVVLTSLCLLGLLALAQTGKAQSAGDKAGKTEPAVQPALKQVFNGDGFLVVGFDQLASFEFTPPNNDSTGPGSQPAVKTGASQIPDRIKALNEKKVMVTGFMLPIKMEQGLVKEFLLVKDPMMCCYGIMPKINEWVVVKMMGSGVPPLMDVPIGFEGKLSVGELYDNGYLTGLYLLEGEKQAAQK